MYTELTAEQKLVVKERDQIKDYSTWQYALGLIGTVVQKTSNKPFKSTFLKNTVTGVVRNPHTHLWGLTFKEDDSVVDVKQIAYKGTK